ncbi:hypothetical protein [Laspinema palackyanum]|uniref:hypothetical protein n=1 Tax=Laspinema palackyanum TaxID=3231601 RepID=UPI00345C6AD0|nr:hypothetical protein [Laspinema sp. D2c]
MGIQSWNIQTGQQQGGVSPHAETHRQGGTDAITPEAIGARPAGEPIPWTEISNRPAIQTFEFSSFEPFFSIPLNFQNDIYIACCCKLTGGGHIGGHGFGGFQYDFWLHRLDPSSPFSTTLIRDIYIGHATQGIILVVATSYGVDIRIVNQYGGTRDMVLQLSVAGTGAYRKQVIF